MKYNKEATAELNNLKRIPLEQINQKHPNDVLLYDKADKLFYNEDKLSDKNNNNLKDLLRVIQINDSLNLNFEKTNILTPRVYAEKLHPIPQHISVQSLLFHNLSQENLENLKQLISTTDYGKTSYDKMWIGLKTTPETIKSNDLIYLMNRRAGGWDGSTQRPVIELLCAGGHLPTVWIEQTKSFKTLEPIELLKREIAEELGISIPSEKIIKLGGFHNKVSNELVILCAIFIDYNQLVEIAEYSKGNISENIDGIYLGIFEDVMNLYDLNPQYFAGGEKAKSTNFPSNPQLMKKIKYTINNNRSL